MEALGRIQAEAGEEIAAVSDLAGLEAWRIKFLGRKSELSGILRSLKDMPDGERRTIGTAANALRRALEAAYGEKRQSLVKAGGTVRLDLSRPGKKFSLGHLHPLTRAMRRIVDIFSAMGFALIEGPEIETERNNFDALNIPEWHPARDLMDTFWIKSKTQSPKTEKLLLRTHTSPVQIRYMESHQPPFRIIAPGRVYRHEATDARHEMQFHQVEGLMVGEDISLANLKAVVEAFVRQFFGPEMRVRMRPAYFPFVEPGAEFDLLCANCRGRNPKCRLCGGSGWLEFMGAGMVHPNVFRHVGYDPNRVTGFAFGFGVERLAMIKYKINDIRLFQSGDLRFIRQF